MEPSFRSFLIQSRSFLFAHKLNFSLAFRSSSSFRFFNLAQEDVSAVCLSIQVLLSYLDRQSKGTSSRFLLFKHGSDGGGGGDA